MFVRLRENSQLRFNLRNQDMKLRMPFQLAIAALFVLSTFATAELPAPMPAHPGLVQLCQPYLAQLRSAGIISITVTGSGHFVRVATNAGAQYFPLSGRHSVDRVRIAG